MKRSIVVTFIAVVLAVVAVGLGAAQDKPLKKIVFCPAVTACWMRPMRL